MKIEFNTQEIRYSYPNERSDTETLISLCSDGIVVSIINDSKTASITLSSQEDVDLFINAFINIKDSNTKNNSFYLDGFLFSATYYNYGFPFEENIEFSICIPDSKRPYNEIEIYSIISIYQKASFKHSLNNAFIEHKKRKSQL